MTTPNPSTVLRKKFPAAEVGKLPKISCSFCSRSQEKVCDKHKKGKCGTCGAWITSGHIHLDYVGHAGVTNRLLDADPAWTWEPVAFDADGAPLVQHGQKESVMWVRLTVGGITRYGVGSAPVGTVELHKQLISDAIRNASMRFGVALDLWAKEPLPELVEQPPELSGGGEPGAAAQAPPAGVRTGEGTPAGVPHGVDGITPDAAPSPVTVEPGEEGTAHGNYAAAVVADPAPPSGPVTLGDLLNRMEGKAAATRKGRLLKIATEIAKEHTWPVPETVDKIDQRLLDAIAAGMPAEDPRAAQRRWMHAVWGLNGGTEARKDAISVLTSGRTDSSNDLTDAEWRQFMTDTGVLPVQLPPRETEANR